MPDLGKPYSSEAERASDREALVLYWPAIDWLVKLAERPAGQWSAEQVAMFPGSVPGGPSEHPQQRLRRWLTLYHDEIKVIQDVRNRLVHGGLVPDAELRGATWLAKQILSTALGLLPSELDPLRVQALVARAAA